MVINLLHSSQLQSITDYLQQVAYNFASGDRSPPHRQRVLERTQQHGTVLSRLKKVDLIYFIFLFIVYFLFDLFFYFLFLEQLGLGLISHAVTI